MRPVRKGPPYLYTDGQAYGKALAGLAARLGLYCSYCERPLQHGAEVEHIQPKSIPAHKPLECRWSNFLLSCKNCNASKSTKDPALAEWLIPDRDNTAAAFVYRKDGVIDIAPTITPTQNAAAAKTLDMLKLNRKVRKTFDQQGNLVALDRRNQRLDAWLLADRYAGKLAKNPSADLADAIADLAKTSGFFSIWLAAFETVPSFRQKLIAAFTGTESACFDTITTLPTPTHPNSDGLSAGGKL
ncbi:MAG TPA: HNH endonuclease [Rhodocyclaceae bacterium]|nr:HNH endonuclease [Rhodocyclaceae bacterium]